MTMVQLVNGLFCRRSNFALASGLKDEPWQGTGIVNRTKCLNDSDLNLGIRVPEHA